MKCRPDCEFAAQRCPAARASGGPDRPAAFDLSHASRKKWPGFNRAGGFPGGKPGLEEPNLSAVGSPPWGSPCLQPLQTTQAMQPGPPPHQ